MEHDVSSVLTDFLVIQTEETERLDPVGNVTVMEMWMQML
jgi:hypothetical protein